MESNIPDPHTSVKTCRHYAASFASIQPQHAIHASRTSILDWDVLHQFCYAPDIDMGIERSRGTVHRVGGPREGIDACTVVGPARCNQLSLFRVKQDDFTRGLADQ